MSVWPGLADATKDLGNWNASRTGGLTCALRYEESGIGKFGAIAFIRTGE